jgi:hypothetical protein
MSFIKAILDYFGKGEHGRKVELEEFKQLTYEDKVELRDGLITEGYDVDEVVKSTPKEAS